MVCGKKRPKFSRHRLIANVETHMNWNVWANNFTYQCRLIDPKVLWRSKLFVFLRLFLVRYFFTGLRTHVLEFKTLISRLGIFFIEVFIDLEF